MPVIIITMLVVILDQLTKFVVNTKMDLHDTFNVIPGILNFTYIRNDGAAWGMLDDKRWIFLIMSTVAICVIIYVLIKYKNQHIMMKIPLALILGGGIGNMIDRTFYTEEILNGQCRLFGEGYRLFEGEVVDFIEAAFINFPVFNIADSAVTIGTILLFVYVIFIDGKQQKIEVTEQSPEKPENSAEGE